ncbi:MAG TPA: hypothetical protein VMX38_17605 [Verrucomicrobiae bacterium]|jgi:hypothetical protein|nr:hypothetical protein [Verrucomicrobiae bacterium]
MPRNAKPKDGHSPLGILTELAVEGTSSVVEAQRALLDLAEQENDILLNGLKQRIGFQPVVAMTDLVRRSVDTLIGMQQELLTNTNKQALQWLEQGKSGRERAAHVTALAREGVETFTRAQKKFLEVLAQETATAMKGKHEGKPVEKKEVAVLAREAAESFIEAQKRLLDVIGQQMNVNLDAATRSLEMLSPSRLLPVANMTGEAVRNFVDKETNFVGSLIKPAKNVTAGKRAVRSRTPKKKMVAVQ